MPALPATLPPLSTAGPEGPSEALRAWIEDRRTMDLGRSKSRGMGFVAPSRAATANIPGAQTMSL